ncbi:hypothetical protein ACM40_06650 [Chryseobacterium sp. BLS98]|nr:hypothetical protein ACM40_06650 [Chryseobacterium sp. BLS98]
MFLLRFNVWSALKQWEFDSLLIYFLRNRRNINVFLTDQFLFFLALQLPRPIKMGYHDQNGAFL